MPENEQFNPEKSKLTEGMDTRKQFSCQLNSEEKRLLVEKIFSKEEIEEYATRYRKRTREFKIDRDKETLEPVEPDTGTTLEQAIRHLEGSSSSWIGKKQEFEQALSEIKTEK